MLTRYRLINVAGLVALHTRHGTFRLEQISDEVADLLHADGSRYVELLPEPAAPVEPAAAPAPAPSPRRPARPRPAASE